MLGCWQADNGKFYGTVSICRLAFVITVEATKYGTEDGKMYTFKITFQLYDGGRKCYTVKAGSRDGYQIINNFGICKYRRMPYD